MMTTAEEGHAGVWDQVKLGKIYISGGHDYWGRQGAGRLQNGIRDVEEVECVAGKGLVGDRYFGYRQDFKGQVTFFEEEVVEEIRAHFKLPKLPASVFRRNLIVSGVRLGEWLGKRFVFQGVEFEGSQECRPCHWMDRVVEDGTERFMKEGFRGGLRAKVISGGLLRVRS
ncbi:molybdenum cofactor biosysynthesis protein [Luteolibacter sp. SL250]|nr:molybdenum cofactor biosysynthesis protein [Luteolibacter sp. SL250]